jgi:uncharacterized membrane protein
VNCEQFLSELRSPLRGLNPQEIDEIVADYRAHFTEAQAAGRSEQEVAEALGDPARLARELRAESGLRRWKQRRTPGNYFGAVVALCGLAAVDLVILLPLICVLAFVAFVIGLVLIIVSLVGVGFLASLLFWGRFESSAGALSVGLAGLGLISGGIGWGALLLLVMEGVLKLLSKYARLHYRLIEPAAQAG